MSGFGNRFTSWLKKQNAGFFFSILFILFSVFFLVVSFDYPYSTKFGIGPGFFPRWVSIVAIIVGVFYLISSVSKDKFLFGDVFPDRAALKSVASVVIGIAVFILIANTTGFVVASSLLLFSIFIRQYNWWQSILLAIVVTVICFLIFRKGFSVPLPVNPWGF